ncbi:MAG: AAA family ATPase [Oscillospiraceae bacterium]|jgi:adenylylsulfate kinase/chloramphenicol 3-O phosphotransferase|nr:AAA family ATPase [Oscillospiraceae bacterium]
MKKGKIVFLCGVTSSGKTSIVDAIQNVSEEFYYVVANDLMVQMVGDKYLNKDYWKYESKAIYYMYHMAKLLSDFGENVLIDGCLLETPELPDHYEKVKEIFKGYPFYLMEIYCPLEICRLRNLERDDRSENQSYEQHLLWTKNVEYDLTVDTNKLSSDDCAKIILQWINAH